MILGVPAVDGHQLTGNLIMSMVDSVADPSKLKVVIIDNGSALPYDWSVYRNYPFSIDVTRYPVNMGFYYPLLDLALDYPDEEIGLIHNDMVLYTHGWDILMRQAFERDPKLGLIGLCGSNEIDERGGRGNGTMCNFMGREISVGPTIYKGQDPSAGRRIAGLEPAAVLDSLFMLFRRDVIAKLVDNSEQWSELPLAHFYDRIWPVRAIEDGYRVGVMGIDCDHLGGMTTTGNERYRADCIVWLDAHNIPYRTDGPDMVVAAEKQDPRNIPCGNPETQMYLYAESRFLTEYLDQKHFIPCRVGEDYGITHTFGRA